MNDAKAVLRERIESNWLAVEKLSRADLELERSLHSTKWFDYRFISPMEATHQFRAAYSKIYQRKYATNIDAEEAKTRTGVRAGPAFATRTELTTFWRSRQHADFFGLPYDVFIEVTFDVFLRDGWTRMPHFNQLYSEKHLERVYGAATAHWTELQSTSFSRSFSHRPEYRNESYHQFPSQSAHRAWVIDLLKTKHGNGAIGDACFVNRVITPESAAAEFGKERVANAEHAVAGELVEPITPHGVELILPSCLGIPGALVPASVECVACPAAALCARLQASTMDALRLRHGTEDPEHDRRKQQQRERTQRFRARKNSAAASAFIVREESTLAPEARS